MAYYLKWSSKVLLTHLLAQLTCFCVGFIVFGMLAISFRWAAVFTSVFLSCAYVVFMYSKVYKIGERDTKSYVHERVYNAKGIVLWIPTCIVSVLIMLLYLTTRGSASFVSIVWIPALCRLWGYSFDAFFGTTAYWVLYFCVPLFSCAFGYFSGMRRWDLGYVFFKNLVYRKKK